MTVTTVAWLVGLAAAGAGVAASPDQSPDHGSSGGVTSRVSVGPGGVQANRGSLNAAISGDGRYVAFESSASNLVAGDTNNSRDVFVRDQLADVTMRVSVGRGGAQADSHCFAPAISADGRYLAFESYASNLVAGDTNNRRDVFVRDRVTELTRRVSVGRGGAQADRGSYRAAISADGRFVAFESWATNLVTRDTNEKLDVFVRNRETHVTRRVSLGRGGAQGNRHSLFAAISTHGRYVAFVSHASNLEAPDTNRASDVFVRDREAHVTRRVSVGRGRAQGNGESFAPALSAFGRYVAFESNSSNLVAKDTNATWDVFVRDGEAHATRRVSVGAGGIQANGLSYDAAISARGQYVAFSSRASNLVAADTSHAEDLFVRDRRAHVTRRVSAGPEGSRTMSFEPAISAIGRHVAFTSEASNLVAGDTNGSWDVFARDLFG